MQSFRILIFGRKTVNRLNRSRRDGLEKNCTILKQLSKFTTYDILTKRYLRAPEYSAQNFKNIKVD